MDSLANFAPDVDLTAELEETPEPVVEQVEQEAQLEVKEVPKEEVKEETPKPPKLVPLEALHESRMKEREWRDKAAQVEKDAAERFQKLEARLEKLVNPPPPVPDFDTDPARHLQHQVATTQAELAVLKQTAAQTKQQQDTVAFEQNIASSTQQAEKAFILEHPDYLAAVQHLQNIADKNLQMMGVEDPAQRQAQIRRDAMSMSLKALQMGKSPADVAYQLATNYGYKAAVSGPTEVSKKIIAIQEGQKAGAMPSGGSKQVPLTLQALEQMDDEDFNKLVEDDGAWKKLIRQMG